MFYMGENVQSLVAGIRFEISYLAVVKLEYQHIDNLLANDVDKITAQFAIGF